MRKLLLLMLILSGLTYHGIGQPLTNAYKFFHNGKAIEPQANAVMVKKALQIDAKKGKATNGYFILQFDKLPTVADQKKLAEQGINLMSYLAKNAYFANVTAAFYSSATANKGLRSIMDIKPEYKISEDLSNGNIPKYAVSKPGSIKVVISYFDKAEISGIKKELAGLKASDVKVSEKFQQITATVLQTSLLQIASISTIENIDLIDPPMTVENLEGRNLHRANMLTSTIPGLGFGLTGKGVTIGLWDLDVENHRDFNGRVVNREFEYHTSDHGTHTAGTITGGGLIDPKTKGMAPEATVYAWNFNTQSNGLNNATERLISLDNDGIEITSNSFGSTPASCPITAKYSTTDKNEDQITNWYPYFLFVYSAGNSQSVCPAGFRTTTKNMKNALIVAAVDRTDKMSSFSSFGPSFDGRVIPNISADGVDVYSTAFYNSYMYMSGTSMATPGVAGTMALVYQRYKETHAGNRPNSSLLIGLACNTALDLGNPGPDYKYGYGEINGYRAVKVMEKNQYYMDEVSQATTSTKTITVPSGASALRVMLTWTDAPGVPGSTVNLVNNLDLKVINNGSTTLPWVLNPAIPSAVASRGVDNLNNQEQVTIDRPAAGTYTIQVDGTSIPAGAQTFAIVYDVVMPAVTLTYPIGGEILVPGDQEIIHWDCEGYTNKFAIEYSEDGGSIYKVIASGLSASDRSFVWTVPAGVTSRAKIRVSNGSVFDVSKGTFTVMAVPQNVNIAAAQCSGSGPYTMTWDVVANARYEILKLNGAIYEHYAYATTNTADVAGLTQSNDNYFCVKAIDLTTGTISERSLAVIVNPSISVAALPFKEDFESQKASNFAFTAIKGKGSVQFVTNANKYGIRLEGSTTSTTWVPGTDAACFINNREYVTNASLCNVDASAFVGKKLRLKFDYRQKFLTAAGTSYFRVKVNGDYLTNTDGTQIYGATPTVSYKTVYYDLSAYAGLGFISIEFEAVNKTNYITYIDANGNYDFSNDTYDRGDFVAIDNVEILEPKLDFQLTSITAGTGMTNNESITVLVKNLSGNEAKNVLVGYQINDEGNTLTEQIVGPIASMAEVSYTFLQKADFSAEGIYTVYGGVMVADDLETANNFASTLVMNDPNSVKIGMVTSPYATCNATFTDKNGKYADYTVNQNYTTTIKPDAVGKNVRITFSEFATEQDYDYLYIYNGPTTASPQLAKLHGSTLPGAYTSTAAGGELTFKFTSDGGVEDKGWIANLSCVDKPSVDLAVTAVSKPTPLVGVKTATEAIEFTLLNNGLQTVTDFDAYYQINSNTPIKETMVSSLAAGASTPITFATLADLSTPGVYSVKVWVDITGEALPADNSKTISVTSQAIAADAGITVISNVYPARTALSTITATIKNLGTTSIASLDVAYKINGGAETVQNVVGPIAAGSTKVVIFTQKADLTSANTTYSIDVYTKLAGDANPANDNMNVQVVTPAAAATNVYGTFNGGVGSQAAAPAIPSMNLINNFSVECWVNLGIPTAFGRIFDKTNVAIFYQGSPRYSSAYPENSYILNVTTATGAFTYYYPGTVKANIWQHLALTVSSTNTYKFYIDGVEQTPILYSGVVAAVKTNTTIPLYLCNNAALTRGVTGNVDEVRVWNSELSQATIASNMVTDYPANTAGLLAYYKFKEGAGKYLYDYSSNDNTAIISGANVTGFNAGTFWNDQNQLLDKVNFVDQVLPITYDAPTKTYFATMPTGTNLSSLSPIFNTVQQSTVWVGATQQTSGVTTNDFTNPVVYTVQGVGFNAGFTQNYTVKVQLEKSAACDLFGYSFQTANNPGLSSAIQLDPNGNNYFKKVAPGTDLSALKASFLVSNGSTLRLDNVDQTNPQTTAIDYTKPLLVTVAAENGVDIKNYSITVDARSSEANLMSFSILNEQVGISHIDQVAHTILIYTKNSTNLASVVPSFSISANAKLLNGVAVQENEITGVDFTNPVVFTVVSEDESASVNWTVTVIKDEIAPVITLIGSSEMTVEIGTPYLEPGATAFDNVDGDITSQIMPWWQDTDYAGTFYVPYFVTDQAGNEASITRKVEVVKRSQTITFNNVIKTYGDGDFAPATTTAPEHIISYSSSNPSVAEIIGGMIHIKAAGVAMITATQEGDAWYNAATPVTVVLTVKKATLVVTPANASRVYGDANPTFTATITGYKNLETGATLNIGVPELICDAKANTPVGYYNIISKIGTLAATNYDFEFALAQLTINKAPLTLTANAQARKYGEANPSFTFGIAGLKNGEDLQKVVNGEVVFTTLTTSQSPAGNYTISCVNALTSTNYDITLVNAILSVSKVELTVIAYDQNRFYLENNPTFTYVIFGYVNGDNASKISGTPVLTTTATASSVVNVYTINVNVSGLTSAYYTFKSQIGLLTVKKVNQTIANTTIPVLFVGNADFALAANTDKGLPITYTSSNTNIATIVAGKIHAVANGTCNIIAENAGGINHNAATTVTRSITVVGTPGLQASNVSFIDLLKDRITVNCTKGDGENRVIFIGLETALATSLPASGVAYTANPIFTKGTKLGTDWYCVSNGTATSATITGLADGTTYKVAVFEYNGPVGSQRYNTTVTANANTKTATTCALPKGGVVTVNPVICQSTTTTALVSGVTNATSYVWTLPSGITGSSITNSIDITVNATLSGSVNLSVQAFNTCGNGAAITKSIPIITVQVPMVGVKWSDVLVCDNKANKYTTYQWYKDGVAIASANSQYFTTNKVVGKYYVKVNDINNCPVKSAETTINGSVALSVSPNPVHDWFSVVYTNEVKGNMVLKLYDLNGRLVMEQKQEKVDEQIDIKLDGTNLFPGVYTLEMVLNGTIREQVKVIKPNN